ncbi:hypothetical protein A0256_14470 [Mucilaginibacter sp. PAMC 26640]|nr:hypothetical protein A0256_14470 [Mucilaginibacter sp. PAMC 26640]
MATNYVQGNKNPWTSNINLVSIGTAALAGAATSGASVVENLAAKTAIKITAKVGAALINNTVEVNTTDGVKVHNVKDVLKNTAIDLAADGVAGKIGGKVEGALSKVGVTNAGRLSSTARAAVRATGNNVTRATTATVKAGLKVATKVVAQTTESTIKATTNQKRDELKKNTNTGN